MSCEDFNELVQQMANDLNALNKSVKNEKFSGKNGGSSQVTVDINYLKGTMRKIVKAANQCQGIE